MSIDECWKECNDGRHRKGRNFTFFNCFQTRNSNMGELEFRDSLGNVDVFSFFGHCAKIIKRFFW